VKTEKEYEIFKDSVPKVAYDYVQSIRKKKKVKWYHEEGSDGTRLECKFKLGSFWHSIEFDSIGQFGDVEIQLKKYNETTISHPLDSLFEKWRILKCQLQLTNSQRALELLNNGMKNPESIAEPFNYEVELLGKKDNSIKVYEILLTSSRDMLFLREIQQNSNANLEF
jgi:hypothetical protein